jgi:hypothetical protein
MLCAVRKELSTLKTGVTEKSLNVLKEKLKVVERENVNKLEEMSTRIDKIQQQVATACKQAVQSASTNVQSPPMNVTVSTEQESCSSRTEESRVCIERRQGNENECGMNDSNVPVRCNVGTNDHHEYVSRGSEQCYGHALNDLVVPKFRDCHKQNVQFLNELDAYYLLKSVPESLKLPVAMKAVTDAYSKQWFTAIYKDLSSYEHFKRAITELLWNPHAQSRTRCALYQDKFDRNKDETMSAHFLRYSVTSAHLTPRLSELELIDAIAGHFPAYVQRAILYANVRTIQEALSFFNKLESMESGDNDRGSNQGRKPYYRQNPNQNAGNNQGRSDRNRQGEHHVRNFNFRGNKNFNGRRRYNRFNQNYN